MRSSNQQGVSRFVILNYTFVGLMLSVVFLFLSPFVVSRTSVSYPTCPQSVVTKLNSNIRWNLYIDKELGFSFCYPAIITPDPEYPLSERYNRVVRFWEPYTDVGGSWLYISASAPEPNWGSSRLRFDYFKYEGPTLEMSQTDEQIINEISKEFGSIYKLQRVRLGENEAILFYHWEDASFGYGTAYLDHSLLVPLRGKLASNALFNGPTIATISMTNKNTQLRRSNEEIDMAIKKFLNTGEYGDLEKVDCGDVASCLSEEIFQDLLKSFVFN